MKGTFLVNDHVYTQEREIFNISDCLRSIYYPVGIMWKRERKNGAEMPLFEATREK
jgi:hypothetical protein